MTEHPIVPTDFAKFKGTRFQEYIHPIIPAGAELSEGSGITAGQLGKIPGQYHPHDGTWAGLHGWTNRRATEKQIDRFQEYQALAGTIAAGMNTIKFPVLDIDINDASPDAGFAADLIRSVAGEVLGKSPVVRRRDGTDRCVLFYEHEDHTPPIGKRAHAYETTFGTTHLVELLCSGQQVVIEGPHAKGAMHYWEAEDGGLVAHENDLPNISITKVCAFFERLDAVMEEYGYTRVRGKHDGGAGANNAQAHSVDDLSSPNIAKDMDLLEQAIKAININDPQLADYDTWLTLLRAMWAACGGDRNFYARVIWPWLAGHPDNKEEAMEAKLIGFTHSQVGAEHVYMWAAACGFSEAIDTTRATQAQELFANAPTYPSPDAGGAQAAPGSDNTGAATAAIPAGGGGPIPPNDTQWETAKAFVAAHGHEWRYNVDTKRWYKYGGLVWQPSDVLGDTLGVMMAAMSDVILRTVNGPQGEARARSLKSDAMSRGVQSLLRQMGAMIVGEDDFDSHHHLLNTPAGVVDLRTGALIDHDPLLLLRQITLVGPDYAALNDYERYCPLFLRVLDNMAAGREWVIPALRQWFAYCLTGDMRHHALMFLCGPPGVGKSQVVQAVFEILHTYSVIIDESSLSKNGGDAKRFDMADWIGKRMGFMDETQLGMKWDETRMSKVSSADALGAEIKFGRRVKFTNTIKLTVVGNHKPNFVAPETGGLTSRMLLVEAEGKEYRNAKDEIKNLAKRIIEEEGPAVLMWAIEACVSGYSTEGLFREVMVEPRKAAVKYAKEESLFHQWANSKMEVHPDRDINTEDAHEAFLKFAKEKDHKTYAKLSLPKFKQFLKAAFPSIEYDRRTTRPQPNKSYIKGFGYRQEDVATVGAGNVVHFPQLQSKET